MHLAVDDAGLLHGLRLAPPEAASWVPPRYAAGRRFIEHDVTIRVHDADSHLFFPGTNQSTPADYDPPQHVDPVVIDDLARWLAPRRGFLARLGLR